MSVIPNKISITSNLNSDTVISGGNWIGNTYTGTGESNDFAYVGVNLQVDESGTLFFDFSQDGVNWSSYPVNGFDVSSGINEVHTAWKGGRYMRPRFVGSGGRSFFRLQTYYSNLPLPLSAPINQSITSDQDAQIVRSITTGEEPDGTFSNHKEDGEAFKTTATLGIGGEYVSPLISMHGWSQIETRLFSDVEGVLTGRWYSDINKTQLVRTFNRPYAGDEVGTMAYFAAPMFGDFVEYTYTNGSTAQNNFDLELHLRTKAISGQLLNVEGFIGSDMVANLGRNVLVGKDVNGTYRNVNVNELGALLAGDFGTEVARGVYPGFTLDTKYGRNSSVNIGQEEDVWNGSTLYTGHNCTDAETLALTSTDANDVGSLVTSGTSTGGSLTTLVDSGATFITNSVSVGDLVINDTQKIHGIISSVDSETQVTVYCFSDGDLDGYTFNSGETYRIANATSTGAAVIRLSSLLLVDYAKTVEYVILNGTNTVNTNGSYIRQARGTIELSGSSDTNEGEITARQSTTTANITMVMPASSGQTAIACDTVPKGEIWIIKRLYCAMGRASGAAGSADVRFKTRTRGGSWKTKRFPTISDSLAYSPSLIGGIILSEGTDVKWNIQSVSDNGTKVSGEFEYFKITL